MVIISVALLWLPLPAPPLFLPSLLLLHFKHFLTFWHKMQTYLMFPAPVLESATFPRSLSFFYWRMVFRTWDPGTRRAYCYGSASASRLSRWTEFGNVCILTRMYPHTCNSFCPICIYQSKHEFILTGLTNPAQALRVCSFFFNPIVSGFFPLSGAQDWVVFMIYVQDHWIFHVSNLLLRPGSKNFIKLLQFSSRIFTWFFVIFFIAFVETPWFLVVNHILLPFFDYIFL